MKGNDIMFERTRIKYNPETGVREVERYNPIKETFGKVKKCGTNAKDFIYDNGEYILYGLSAAFLVWAIGLNNGVDLTNKAILRGYKDDGYLGRGDGMVFKKKMSFDDWMGYLDHIYNTKGGKKTKNMNRYLREKGFID